MATFRHFVVVSVSAALAGGNTPAIALNNTDNEVPPTIPALTQFQHHPPGGDALPTPKGEERGNVEVKDKILDEAHLGHHPDVEIKDIAPLSTEGLSAIALYPPSPPQPLTVSPSRLSQNPPETIAEMGKVAADRVFEAPVENIALYPPSTPQPLTVSPSRLSQNPPETITEMGKVAADRVFEEAPVENIALYPPSAPQPLTVAKSPLILGHNPSDARLAASREELTVTDSNPVGTQRTPKVENGGEAPISNHQTVSVSSIPEIVLATPGDKSRVTSAVREAQPLAQAGSPGAIAQTSPITPIRPQNIPVPRFLDPNPNPLQFPTRPNEVDIETTQPLTLQQAIELARRNNQNLQVAQFQLERSQAALREALAGLYPTVDLQAEFSGGRSAQSELSAERQAQQPNPFTRPEDIDATTTSINSTVAFNYDVYTGGRGAARRQAAREQVRLSQLEVERLLEQTRLDVSNAYYDLQQADEQVRISESAVRNATRSLGDAQALFEAGLGTRFDVLRAQVQLARENQTLIRARSDQLTARRQLAQLLSVPQSVNVVAADPVEIAGLWNPTLEQSIVLAFQNRAELQQRIAERNINQQQRRIALADKRPQVSLFFNYNLLDVFNDGLGLADGYSAGARLRWNLFDAGAAQARADQEEAEIAIAETQFASQRNDIRFRVERAYFDLQANLENIQTASVALEQAREALRLARLRFQAGVGTQTEVIDAENDLTRAEGDRVRAILDYNRALATLQREISNLTPTTAGVAP